MGKQMTEMLKGTLEGIVLAILAVQPAYGYEITARLRERGLLRHRRGHRLRAAGQDRAARLRRRREGPVREGAAAQGLLAEHAGRRVPRRVLEDLELPRRTDRTAPPPHRTPAGRRRVTMAAKWIETLTGSLEQKKQYGSTRPASKQLPEPLPDRGRRRSNATSCTPGGIVNGDVLMHDARRPRRPVGARRRRRHADPRHRRRRPGRVRRDLRRRPTPEGQWIDKERERLTDAIDGRRRDAERAGNGDGYDHRPGPRTRDPGAGHREVLQGPARAARRRLRRQGGAASSPCSARTAPARPRWCGSCRRC